MAKIIDLLKYHDDLYFNYGKPEISDTEYDQLRNFAKSKFPDDPYFKTTGAPIKNKYEEIPLEFPMGGLDKVTPDNTKKFFEGKNNKICASEKLDGESIGCTWNNCQLTYASTKGDGITGQNILEKARFFVPPLPQKYRNYKISLRGEILLLGDLYKKMGFKNRRNGVAGLIRRDEINPDDLKQLVVYFYEIIEAPEIPEFEDIRLLYIQNSLNLKIPDYKVFDSKEENVIEQLEQYLIECKSEKPYDIDGLVLTILKSDRENVLTPKNKVKFKVNEQSIKCTVIDIEWNVTRTGLIKPVIIINPVEIQGVTVSRVSGFNYEYMINNQIGVGSVIGVVRSGDVIPYVTEIYETSDVIKVPMFCPECKTRTKSVGKEITCDNSECFIKNIYIVSHFFTSLGVESISDTTVKNIGITSIEKMYQLKKEDLIGLPGFAKRKAEIVVDEIQKTLNTKPENLLAAFGIPLVGKTLSKQLCSKFTIDELFNINDPELLDIGPITSKTLIDNLQKYKSLYNFLKSIGLKFIQEDESTKTLKGLKFALTGEGPMKRSELQKLLESLGAVVGSVGKETNYLVTNEPTSNSGKMSQAKKYQIKIISYDELFKSFINK